MTYRLGRVIDSRKDKYLYYHGHLIKPKKKLPKVLMALGLLVSLPCAGIWLATNNFSGQPDQVLAESSAPMQVVVPVMEPEKLPQTGPGSETNPEVQRFLHQWVLENGKNRWGIYVEQLGDKKQVASINADRQFGTASLYKLFIPGALAQNIPAEQWARLQTSESEPRTIDRCIRDMLRISDNNCALELASSIGWSNLDAYAKSRGHVFTHLSSDEYMKSTARDVALLLKDLQVNNGFGDILREKIMNAMKVDKTYRGIPLGCEGCLVYNKTGDADGFRNDAAIIDYQGKKFVLVVMSEGGSYRQITELTKGILEKFQVPLGAPALIN